MEQSARLDALLIEFPKLWNSLKFNIYPEDFLRNVLGFGPKLCERLPQYLMCFVGLYLLCGGLTVFFRFRLGQKPLNSIPRQMHAAFLAGCAAVLLPLLIMLAKVCAYIVRYDIAPLQGRGDYLRYAGDALSNILRVAMVFAALLLAVWVPLHSVFRYLKVYRLRGVPHLIFEVGTGIYLLCVILLAAAFENKLIYALILPAGALLGIVQSAGYIPEADHPPFPERLELQELSSLIKTPDLAESASSGKEAWPD